jgi:hypothetical protein
VHAKQPGETGDSQARSRIPAVEISGWGESDDFEQIVLRFRGGRISGDADKPVEIKLFVDAGSDDDLDAMEHTANFLGTFKRRPNDDESILFFDVTEPVRRMLGRRASFTVRFASPAGSLEWKSVELAIFRKEATKH